MYKIEFDNGSGVYRTRHLKGSTVLNEQNTLDYKLMLSL